MTMLEMQTLNEGKVATWRQVNLHCELLVEKTSVYKVRIYWPLARLIALGQMERSHLNLVAVFWMCMISTFALFSPCSIVCSIVCSNSKLWNRHWYYVLSVD